MEMAQKQVIWPFFLIALFFSLNPIAPLIAFAPFLALTYYRFSFIPSLWMATLCGLISDLLSPHIFGIYALNYACVTFLIFRYRIYFVEKPIGLASLTLLISIISSCLSIILFFLYGIPLPFTLKGFCTDFTLMPLLDGVYALLCFSYPLILYRFLRRQWFRFLFLRKQIKKKEESEV